MTTSPKTNAVKRFRPVRQEVLLESVEPKAEVGGILIPEKHREAYPEEAVIVALAVGAKIDAQIGDRVLTDRYAGKHIEMQGRVYRVVEADAILAVVNN